MDPVDPPEGAMGFCVAATLKRVLNRTALREADPLHAIMMDVARETRMTVVGSQKHQFEPEGASVCLLLSESHFACHTWPEYAMASVHVYTCSEPGKALSALRAFSKRMNSNIVKMVEFNH